MRCVPPDSTDQGGRGAPGHNLGSLGKKGLNAGFKDFITNCEHVIASRHIENACVWDELGQGVGRTSNFILGANRNQSRRGDSLGLGQG